MQSLHWYNIYSYRVHAINIYQKIANYTNNNNLILIYYNS